MTPLPLPVWKPIFVPLSLPILCVLNEAGLIAGQRKHSSPHQRLINSALYTQLRAHISLLCYYILPIKHQGQPPHLYRFTSAISNLVMLCSVPPVGSVINMGVRGLRWGGGDGGMSVLFKSSKIIMR